jgi:hypothetical protein
LQTDRDDPRWASPLAALIREPEYCGDVDIDLADLAAIFPDHVHVRRRAGRLDSRQTQPRSAV